MFKKLFVRLSILVAAALTLAVVLLTIATASVVALGTLLSHFVSSMSLDFAYVVAGLAVLAGLSFLSVVVQFIHLAGSVQARLDDEELDDEDEEESAEFAEQIAEIVTEKLEPHFWREQRSKSRRRHQHG